MSIASDLATLFRRATPITGSVAGKTVEVYAVAVPQKSGTGGSIEPPLIIITTLSTNNHNTIDNPGNVATGTRTATLDFDCKGVTEKEANTIEKAVEKFFGDYSGVAGESTIESVELTDSSDDTETPEHGQGLPIFVKTIDADVIFKPL